MVTIMENLHHYVPKEVITTSESVPGAEAENDEAQVDVMHKILLGGDQLTVARARGAQRIRANSQHGAGRLEGLIPVVEDWHAKVCLLEVSCCI